MSTSSSHSLHQEPGQPGQNILILNGQSKKASIGFAHIPAKSNGRISNIGNS